MTTPTETAAVALDEARARLAALDEVPLEQHPAQFSAIDTLLRSALDPADGPARASR